MKPAVKEGEQQLARIDVHGSSQTDVAQRIEMPFMAAVLRAGCINTVKKAFTYNLSGKSLLYQHPFV